MMKKKMKMVAVIDKALLPHFNQSKLTALVCGCGNHFLLDLGAEGVLQSVVSTQKIHKNIKF